ncbi:holin [Acinetobacter guerrae]|uniref:holin n=1 Tax=Acinetobacter guerrae TaxID=1843371 RepID=UPI00128B30CD|nr:holin [Acinetobacter guerrae]MPW44728.1 holin [Acinetobacter guerrae]
MQDTSTVEASAVAISQKVTMASSMTSFFAFMAQVDVIAWGGLFIAACGLLIQLYFAIGRNRREKIEHQMKITEHQIRVERLKGGNDVEQD